MHQIKTNKVSGCLKKKKMVGITNTNLYTNRHAHKSLPIPIFTKLVFCIRNKPSEFVTIMESEPTSHTTKNHIKQHDKYGFYCLIQTLKVVVYKTYKDSLNNKQFFTPMMQCLFNE